MTKKGVNARKSGPAASDEPVPTMAILRRVGWLIAAGTWLFLVVALASFDSGDPPSYVVAVHNDPVVNLCGRAGAAVAYGIYQVIGVGAWLVLAVLGGFLATTLLERRIDHPVVRTVGLVIAALALSSFHALLWPAAGPLAGAPAGVTAATIVGELVPRFSTVGTFLLLIAGLAIGLVVAIDSVVLLLARVVLRTVGVFGAARSSMKSVGKLLSRPRATIAVAGGGAAIVEEDPEDEYEYEDEYEDEGEGEGEEEEDEDEYEYEDEDGEYEEEEDDEEEDDEEEYEEEDAAEEEEEEDAHDKKKAKLSAAQLREKIARLPVSMAGRDKRVARDEDIPRTESFAGYEFPTLDLLADPQSNYSAKMESCVRKQAEILEEALQTYGIDAEVVGIDSGPAVTLYSVQLAPGTKVAKISAISSDIARALRTQNIRIVPNIVGKSAIGIEVPNLLRERVRLKELMSGGHAAEMKLPMFLGKDSSGEPLVADLTRMPHMLIAGTTGSGKSVCMNSILMSWLYTKRPDELKLVLVDPKMVEMSQFAEIPHLMCPVVTESTRAAAILEWAVERMEERYELMKEAQVRDIASYNKLSEEELYELFAAESDEERARIPKRLPFLVFVIDELADLMMTCKEVEHAIVRIAQKARAVGMHLILATQRPQANVVTGLIKSNMPCRVSFKVSSGMDSRIVLDSKGAELLLGQGDMMMLTPHKSDVMRAQGTLVEDAEIRKVVKFLKTVAAPSFERSLMTLRTRDTEEGGDAAASGARDPLFDSAVRIMIESGRGSVSLIQRRLSIGYGRASRLVDQMSAAGIVGDHKGSVAREVLISLEDWERMKKMEEEGDEDEDAPVVETTASREPVPAEYDDEYRN